MTMVIAHQRGNRKSALRAILQHGRKNCPNAPIQATSETIREMPSPIFPEVEMSADHKTLLVEREMSADHKISLVRGMIAAMSKANPNFLAIVMTAGHKTSPAREIIVRM
jgi:hypothetical protein